MAEEVAVAKARLAQARAFEDRRLAEQRGREPGRGQELFAESPSQVAQDVFRRTTDLGGHLIVAFVAPVSAFRSS
jgi:hypothetical protein